MNDSQRLLREYATKGSEAAFAELVTRYINLVYSSAVRLLGGDTHAARDVSQIVFIDLARKAPSLGAEVTLGGWLHRHTCFVVASLRRSERRRQLREKKAAEMSTLQDHSQENLAGAKAALDEAINQLDDNDRTAILLRFFEQHDFRSLGAALGSSENAAQKRVARALEALRSLLIRRGFALPASALAAALTSEAASAAPTGLAAAVSSAALTTAAAAHATTFTLWKFMAMTKLKLGILSAIALAAVVTPITIQHQYQKRLGEKDSALLSRADRLAQLEAENQRLSNLVAQAKNSAASPTDPSAELLRLRGEVGILRQKTIELAKLEQETRERLAQAQTGTNLVSLEDRFMLRQTHAVDAITALLQAVQNYSTNHGGLYPSNLDELNASNDPAVSTLAGNLALSDFELNQAGAVDPQGNKFLLRIRVPLQKPSGGSVLVEGGISDKGLPSTSIWNVSP
jgi:RNA polymerase sigma factor (sigma-70 family)